MNEPTSHQPDANQITQTQLITQEWQGPVPSPDQLAKFEQVLPGAAERIFRMAEKEQEQRHSNEKVSTECQTFVVKKEAQINAMARVSGIVFLWALFVASIFFAYEGNMYAASGLFCSVVVVWLLKLIAGLRK